MLVSFVATWFLAAPNIILSFAGCAGLPHASCDAEAGVGADSGRFLCWVPAHIPEYTGDLGDAHGRDSNALLPAKPC